MENLLALNRNREKDKNLLHIDWFIGKRCNFDCVYCTPAIHDNFSPHVSLENMIGAAQTFLENYPPEKIRIGFTGGEPTVNPDFLKFCKYLYNQGIKNTIVTTNGTRTTKYYLELLEYTVHLTFSQHFGQSQTADVFRNRLKEINDNKGDKSIVVQVMAHAEHFDEVKRCVEFYKEHNINFTIRKIRPETEWSHDATNYTEEYLEWIIKNQEDSPIRKDTTVVYNDSGNIKTTDVHVNEISGKDKNFFKGWKCWAGILHLHIYVDGVVYRGNCRVGGSLGNINDNSFKFPKDPIICTKDRCVCAPEISVKKVKEDQYLKYIEENNV